MKLHAAWQAIRAAYESTAMAAEVRASLLQLTQEVGQFVLALFRDEAVGFADHLSRDLQRQGIDETKAIEHVLWLLERYADHQVAFDDQKTEHLGKQSLDAVGLVDQSRVGIQKLLDEHPVLGDWAYRLTAKPLFEASLLLDQDSRQTGKDAKEKASAIDTLTDDFLKSIIETACFEESMRRATTKLIADRATVTDDVDGAWTAEDDQEIAFLKQVQHRLALSDDLIRSVGFTRTFSNQALVLAMIQVILERLAFEPIGFSDQRAGRFAKFAGEYVEWLDLITKASVQKHNNDAIAFDHTARDFSRTGLDALSVDDSRVSRHTKPLGDALQLNDTTLIKPEKTVSDRAAFVDSLIRSIGFIRNFEDRAQLHEAIARSAAKLSGDASIASDHALRQSKKTAYEQALVAEASRRDVLRTVLEYAFISSVAVLFLERRLSTDGLRANEDLIRWIGSMRGDQLELSDRLQQELGSSLADRSVALDQLTKHGNVLRMDGVASFDRREMASSKRSSDAVVMTDSGFWDQQSYAVDPAFFAADYVGKRQYF